jgi:hypothetical protein
MPRPVPRRWSWHGAAKAPNSPDLDHCKHLRHTATMARNKVMDVSAQASSTTARTIMLSGQNLKGTLVHVMFGSQWAPK